MIEVLIIDDSDHKIDELTQHLNEFDNVDISVAKSINEALKLVKEKIFDLAFVDLALPRRFGEEAVKNGGLELIREVHEMEWYKKPKSIIAVTQHDNLKSELHQSLEEFGVAVICSNGTSDLSQMVKANLEACIKNQTQTDFKFDILVIAALDEEASPIIEYSNTQWTSYSSPETEDLDIKTATLGNSSSSKKVALVVLPRMGLVMSSIVTSRLVSCLRPKVVLMPGICAGLKSEVNEGDLIIINHSWEWQTGKWKGQKFDIEPYQIAAEQKIVKTAKELCERSELDIIWKDTSKKRPDNPPKAHIGAAVSGSSVIANGEMMSQLKQQHRKLLGLEMEVFGVYSACVNSTIKPLFLGYKSVCDFGTEEKGDSFHEFCAELSGKYTISLINAISI